MRTCFAGFEKKKVGRLMFYSLLSMLLLLCLAQYVFQIYIPQVMFLAVAFLIALTGDADEIIAMCVCCIPLHNFFEFSFAVLFGIACYVYKYGKRIRLNYSIIPVAMMILWELLHCFMPDLNVMQFGGLCVPWLLLMLLMCASGKAFDYDFIVRAVAFTVVAMCSLLICRLMYLANFNVMATFANLQRLGVETEGAAANVKVNPNTLGIMCVLGIVGLMQLRIAGRVQKYDIVFTIAMLLFGVMTASKTFLFCLLFAALLLLFSTEGSVSGKLRYLFSLLAITLVVLVVSYLVMPGQLNYFISRFYEKDFTTGRLSHMAIYGEFILSNLNVLLCGIGLQDFGNRLLQLCEPAIFVPHNGILELIIAWGLPGIVLFLILWMSMIVMSRKMCRKQGLVNYIPLLVMLLKIQAGQMVTSAYTMLTFSLAYLSMCADLRPGSESFETLEATSQSEGLELSRAISLLLRKKWLIVTVALMCSVTAYGVSHFLVTPMYESSVLIYVNNGFSIDNLDSISQDDVWVSRNLKSTYKIMLKSRSFLTEVMEYTGVRKSYEEFRKIISFESANETEIFKVVVSSEDPAEAEAIANGIAVLLPSYIESIITGTSAKMVDYAAIASRPSSPSKQTNAMVGFIFGGVLIVWLILLRGISDKTIHSLADFAEIENYPLLAVVPDIYKANKPVKPPM